MAYTYRFSVNVTMGADIDEYLKTLTLFFSSSLNIPIDDLYAAFATEENKHEYNDHFYDQLQNAELVENDLILTMRFPVIDGEMGHFKAYVNDVLTFVNDGGFDDYDTKITLA